MTDFYLQHQRAIWLVGGLVLAIALLTINTLRHRRDMRLLRESKRRWERLFRAGPGGCFIVNKRRRIADVNDSLCQMTGYRREELLSQPCRVLCATPPEQCLSSGLGQPCQAQGESVITRKDGVDVPVLRNTQQISLAGDDVILVGLQDLSHRKKLEHTLLRSEETERGFRERLTVLHEVNLALTHAEHRDDLCKLAVELARDKLGFERLGVWFVSDQPGEITGSCGIDEQGLVRDERMLRQIIRPGSPMGRALAENKPGTFCQASQANEVPVASTLWDGGRIIGFLIAQRLPGGREISQVQQKVLNLLALSLGHMCTRLAMGQEQTQLEAQLRQAAKMEAVGRLAGGIAHDFNNQLTVITGYCDLLLRGLPRDDQSRESIEQIEKSARQASSLTGELLNFSRKEIVKPDVIDPAKAIWGMEKPLAMLGEDIRLEIRADDGLGNIRVDANRFQQAIMNLAINARDAMPEGGCLSIRATNYSVSPPLAARLVSVDPGPYVRISISDTGVGMDEETQQKVFEPFFTTKDRGKGTGLGLSLVYGFVQQSDGQIDIQSTPGAGTTFHIYLPRVAQPVSNDALDQDESPAESSHETVLVVEDDAAVRRLVVRVLRDYGYAVLETGHPEDALRMVRQLDKPIDLLISDVVMPGLSGPKLAEALESIQPDLKVLYMSGYTEETVLKHGVDDSLASFLHKPFSPEELCRAIAGVLVPEDAPADAESPVKV